MNDTLCEYLDQFCVVYIDDILIYSKNKKDHREQVRKVLAKLKEAGLYIKPEKCKFNVEKTTFLGFVISPDGIEIDPVKISAIVDWQSPASIKDIQCFLGFANFYQRFIYKYSNLCQPMFNLLRKNTPFIWSSKCKKVFKQLKSAFTTAPILHYFNPELETILETDASDYILSGILSKKHIDPDSDTRPGADVNSRKPYSVLHPVAFMSEKMSPAESNYGIGDKELLAIIVALQKWQMYLHALPSPFTIFTDHHNLQTFTIKTLLSRRQARWAQELAEYNFKIIFRPGKLNGKADAVVGLGSTQRKVKVTEKSEGFLIF